MDRRHFSIALAAAMAAPLTARAQSAVFLDYTQDALDKAYDQRVWAPNAQEVIARYASDSAAVRQKYPPKTERYGESEAETLDIFAPAGAKDLPVMVFIHGGAWRALGREDASAPATSFVENGCLYVALNFANIPAVRLPEMAAQCRRALLWVHRNIARLGGDPQRIFVSGHSSGGHLCGVMLTSDWSALGGPRDLIKGGVAMSGMYELYPVMLSARSSYVDISTDELAALSAMRHLDRIACNVIVAFGDKESPEFQRQSNEFATALAGMGRLTRRIVLPGPITSWCLRRSTMRRPNFLKPC
ncbi:Esterase [Bosea sp. 62]|uniref:alpha/beta hydrolase n=1 Tax=unclassified Bosea (in: a-proteobacteria) TaxID=2653178 RepID=UPI001251D3EE|nr:MULTISPECIES: alpha/beta hydrolase [unclassified Bosea (in: a-proteobacteria)]CAD5264639.1 Esterase [Bosea sp. 46]CAD5267005.1 Esterase [Bosea sp. 21B]CAD5272277.1 Esterase [Bosea sp. 7B]VVT55983.1 Esterase [Bosea sp. EC-HK365B]VXB83215.1 Esterase [Bosea sp. 29B]